MPVKSPSNKFSVKKLKEIKANYYSNLDRGIDYIPNEVDELIWQKEQKIAEKELNKMLREQKTSEVKKMLDACIFFCTGCKQIKPLEEFSKRSNSPLPRSRCKICRRNATRQWRYVPF